MKNEINANINPIIADINIIDDIGCCVSLMSEKRILIPTVDKIHVINGTPHAPRWEAGWFFCVLYDI
jgi:hypothetical protein